MPYFDGRDGTRLAVLNVGWLGCEVGNMHYSFDCQHPAHVGIWVGMDRCAPEKFGEGRLCRFYCNVVQGVAVPAADTSYQCVANADGVIQHGFEYRLQIAWRAANDLK